MRDKVNHFWSQLSNKKGSRFFLMWLLFFGLAILVRLPHLLSKASFFDGDEGIIGIMANDLIAGRSFPIYFYGQAYGFSMFEVWSSAFWIALIGKGLWALRLAGLTMFSLGATFLFVGLLKRGRSQLFSCLVIIAMLSFPTWMIWGMLVRGGYVTSFLAIAIIFYLLSKKSISNSILIGLAFLLAVTFEAHSLLLIPVLPLLLRDWLKQNQTWQKLMLGGGLSIVFVFLLRLSNWNKSVWDKPTPVFEKESLLQGWHNFHENLLNIYSDFYAYSMNFEIPGWWSVLLIATMIIGAAIALYMLVVSKRIDRFFWVLWGAAQCGVLLIAFSVYGYSPRYYVAFFTGFFFLFIFYEDIVAQRKILKFAGIFCLLMFLAGAGAGSKIKREFYDTNVHCMETFEEWHMAVIKEKKKAVFLSESLLQWQWNYMYGDEIPAAPFWKEERTNRFIEAVDGVYQKDVNDVALIGYWGHFHSLDSIQGFNDTRYHINKKYYVQPVFKPMYYDHFFK